MIEKEALFKGFQEDNQFETLLGVTGSGKPFTMANVIRAECGKNRQLFEIFE
ncbi:hypothetical protein [Lacrimispora sp. 210928-DFI.3.58]|uniref:hypothetical protein n=1 Tax=Lacrimispora sp. 210928-DFI.3.58 TaxID=2883214 RepID=UPI001D0726F3|nr:hypothetical protein [Lacrimispora sp. 210928-DFI.3.58]MCB7320442.1 hypothetical protein [Lacrimispora sp. 210928-DFI.3.58]